MNNNIIIFVFALSIIGSFSSLAFCNDTDLYVQVKSENLRVLPNGAIIGELVQGTKLNIKEEKGNWVKVSVDGWIWKPSTSEEIIASTKNTPSTPKLELIDFDVEQVTDSGLISFPKVKLTLHVKNNTSKRISAWRVVLVVKNSFGDQLLKGKITDGTANIFPGEIGEASFAWEDNPFLDGEPYDKLTAYSKENLKLSMIDIKLVH